MCIAPISISSIEGNQTISSIDFFKTIAERTNKKFKRPTLEIKPSVKKIKKS
jgi:hypothetical protein